MAYYSNLMEEGNMHLNKIQGTKKMKMVIILFFYKYLEVLYIFMIYILKVGNNILPLCLLVKNESLQFVY